MRLRTVFVSFDGYAGVDGVRIRAAVRDENGKVLKQGAYELDEAMSDAQAEYAAMLDGIALARSARAQYVVFITRSERLHARLMRGEYVRPNLRSLHRVVLRAIDWALAVRWTVWHIDR